MWTDVSSHDNCLTTEHNCPLTLVTLALGKFRKGDHEFKTRLNFYHEFEIALIQHGPVSQNKNNSECSTILTQQENVMII